MGKRGRSQARGQKYQRMAKGYDRIAPQDMDDEIDAFHKKGDVIPLEVNGDTSDSFDSDDELPVFGNEDIDEAYDEEDDDEENRGLAAKIVKQQKFLRSKFGGVDDEMAEEDEEEEKRIGWGGKKARYHGGDNRDFELKSSDDEALKEEEEEILRLQKEKAKLLSMEDFGLEEFVKADHETSKKENDNENTLFELSAVNDSAAYFKVDKDQSSLSKEEQMDVINSSAPELIGLLSELNASVDELENKLNPIFDKLKVKGIKIGGGWRYLEVKQLLLLSYCQAISFYLLLKSEGHSIRGHPILARIVEIKDLLEKTKKLDENLPKSLDDIMRVCIEASTEAKSDYSEPLLSAAPSEGPCDVTSGGYEMIQPESKNLLMKTNSNKEHSLSCEREEVGVESLEMLKVRAALEAKLKNKGLFSAVSTNASTRRKNLKLLDGNLESIDDYNDVSVSENDKNGSKNGRGNASKLFQSFSAKQNKPKVISGDDDIPKRDDIGERRKKHELRVLAGAGIKSEEDFDEEPTPAAGDEKKGNLEDSEEAGVSDTSDEFYNEVMQKRAEKLASKSEMFKRTPAMPSAAEMVEGKRLISHQMEKNRGLTRARNKQTKNPRKKYRAKHDKAQKRRKGQVRDIKKAHSSYGGETSGINPTISRSVRF